MKITQLFNTTEQKIENKEHNIFIPICLGNKFFADKTKINKKNIKDYITWALKNTKEKVLIVIVDKIQNTNIFVRSHLSTKGAQKKALKDGKEIKKNIEMFIQENFLNEQNRINIISFQGYEDSDILYKETRSSVYKEFENNNEFRNTVLYVVKSSIGDRVFTNKQYLKLCNYVLDEFSLAYHGAIYNGIHYDMYIYPIADTVLYFIFDIIYQKRFIGLSKNIDKRKVSTVILNHEITSDSFYKKNRENADIKDFYNKAADIYDEVIKQHCANIMPKSLAEFYSNNNINSGSILDLGCGTGSIAKKLQNGGFNFTFTGIDFAENMTKYAQAQYENIYIGDMVETISQFHDNSFDHVIALSSVYTLNQKKFEKLIIEIKRVCRKSIFMSCEQFEFDYIPTTQLKIYNHNPENFDKSALQKMWHTSQGKIPIFGYFYSKIL